MMLASAAWSGSVKLPRSRPVPPVKPSVNRREGVTHHSLHGSLDRHKSLETLLEQPEKPACLFLVILHHFFRDFAFCSVCPTAMLLIALTCHLQFAVDH